MKMANEFSRGIQRLRTIQLEINELMNELQNYDEVVVIDTGKSDIHFSSALTIALLSRGQKVHHFHRNSSPAWSEVSSDRPEFSAEKICTTILREPLVP